MLPIGGLCGTYHLLREPETTIDHKVDSLFRHLEPYEQAFANDMPTHLTSWKTCKYPSVSFFSESTRDMNAVVNMMKNMLVLH